MNKFFGWVEWSLHTGITFVFSVSSVLILPFVEIYTNGITDVNYIRPLFAMLIMVANAGHQDGKEEECIDCRCIIGR